MAAGGRPGSIRSPLTSSGIAGSARARGGSALPAEGRAAQGAGKRRWPRGGEGRRREEKRREAERRRPPELPRGRSPAVPRGGRQGPSLAALTGPRRARPPPPCRCPGSAPHGTPVLRPPQTNQLYARALPFKTHFHKVNTYSKYFLQMMHCISQET